MSRRLKEWFLSRTGADEFWRRWMHEKIPPRLNWLYTLGGLALFLFLVQLITGVVLAFYYASAPDAAYLSVQYFQDQVLLGSWIRALHYWGASFMVAVVLLHMARVFWYGSFKAPREVTWITGVILLLLVLGFGFTGYLLPWDQRAYWGTVVGTNIAGLVPGLGKYLQAFLLGGGEVGALTLSRFYAAHVVLLPGIVALLMAVHLSLMRRHGVAPLPGDRSDSGHESFYPKYAARDAVVVALILSALLLVAWFWPAPLGPPADLSASGEDPKPEWYFLAFYQLLKYLPGSLEVVGAVVIPALIILLLLAVPFLDRKEGRNIGARKPFALAGSLLVLAIVVLTFLGARSGERDRLEPRISEMAGAYFFGQRCLACHELSRVQSSPPDFWVRQHAREKNVRLTDSDRGSLVAAHSIAVYLRTRPPLDLTPMELEGAGLYAVSGCGGCHSLLGGGGVRGPSLSQVGSKRDQAWLIEHFRDPAKMSPGSKMPPVDYLSEAELEALSQFLLRFR